MTLDVSGLTHQYGSKLAIDDVSFSVGDGELVALLGPSGCGKTTIVQAIAGHITPTAGTVSLRGQAVTAQPPEARGVGVVFQEPTLYPHLTVAENVAYGLKAQGMGATEREQRVESVLALVDLSASHDAMPTELSGGQRRRVELARALAPKPDILLLDEPLSALDRALRRQLQAEIRRIQAETGVTTLVVTHDQQEAMSLADRLVVIQEGQVAAVGEPRELYHSPPNRFVGSFLGRANTLEATGVDRTQSVIWVGGTAIEQPDPPETDQPVVQIRPESVTVGSADDSSADEITFSGQVVKVSDVGTQYDIEIELPTGERLVGTAQRSPPGVDETVSVGIDRRDLVVFDE